MDAAATPQIHFGTMTVPPSLAFLTRRRDQMIAHLRTIDGGDVSGGETLHRVMLRARVGDLEARIATLKASPRS